MQSPKTPLLLVLFCAMAMGLSLSSCTKEEQFGIWLSRKGGNWEVATMQEQTVEYTGTDSISSEVTTSESPASAFSFDKDQGTLTYNLTPVVYPFQLSGSGARVIQGENFYFLDLRGPSSIGETTRTTMIGSKRSTSGLRIEMRLEQYSINNELYLVHKFDMELNRAE